MRNYNLGGGGGGGGGVGGGGREMGRRQGSQILLKHSYDSEPMGTEHVLHHTCMAVHNSM